MERLIGVLIVFTSTVLYAAVYPILKKVNTTLPPFLIMAITSFIVFALAAIASIFFENTLNIKSSLIKDNMQILLIGGVVNFIAYWLAISGFKYMPVWQQDMFMLLTPIAAGILAYFILGEKITSNLFIGLAIMGIGLFVALR
ncbi:MAG TPA: DMT family transporter [Patescibacteria group bacterium]|nr:DMT family transporter [Patescibacteria group bacterium]